MKRHTSKKMNDIDTNKIEPTGMHLQSDRATNGANTYVCSDNLIQYTVFESILMILKT